VTKQLFAAALCRGLRAREYCFPQFPECTPHVPVGASLLAMDVNENASILDECVVLETFASKLAPTGDCGELGV
jgi:hypothetical protein